MNLNPKDRNGSDTEVSDKMSKQQFCRRCGGKIPAGEDFCPFCGMSIEEAPPPSSIIRVPTTGFRRVIFEESKRIRISLFILSLTLLLASMAFGTQVQLSSEETSDVMRWAFEFEPTVSNLLLNNAQLCILFSVPIFGTPFIAFVGYNSGIVLSAIASSAPISVNPLQLFLNSLLFPWAWIEYIAYSLTSTQGIMFLLGFYIGQWKKEGKNLLIVLGVSILLIGIGAIIEAAAIKAILAEMYASTSIT